MRRPSRPTLIWLLLAPAFSLGSAAQTAPPTSPAEKSPPHEKLRFFEGLWTTTDSTPEDNFREKCSWLPEGRRHMVCVSRWKTRFGLREGMSIFSFDQSAGRYVYSGFRAGGAVARMHGEERGGSWHFSSDEGAGTTRVRTRVVIEPIDGRRFLLSSERSTGDGPWSQPSKVTYQRVAE